MALKSGRKYSVVCKPRLARAAALASLGISLIQVDGMHISTKKKLEAQITNGGSALELAAHGIADATSNLAPFPFVSNLLYVGGSVNKEVTCGDGIQGHERELLREETKYIFVVGGYSQKGYGHCVVEYLRLRGKGVKLLVANDPAKGMGAATNSVELWPEDLKDQIFKLDVTAETHWGVVEEVFGKFGFTHKQTHKQFGMLVFSPGPVMSYEATQGLFAGKKRMLNAEGKPLYNNVLYVGGSLQNDGKPLGRECSEKIEQNSAVMHIDYIFVVGGYLQEKKAYGECVKGYLLKHATVKLLVAPDPNNQDKAEESQEVVKAMAGEGDAESWSKDEKDLVLHERVIPLTVPLSLPRVDLSPSAHSVLGKHADERADGIQRHWNVVNYVFKTLFGCGDAWGTDYPCDSYRMLVIKKGETGGTMLVESKQQPFSNPTVGLPRVNVLP